MTEAAYTPPAWMKHFWLVLFVVQSAILLSSVVAFISGTPDSYHNQHLRIVLIGAGSWFISLSFLASRPAVKNGALVASLVLLAGHVLAMR